MLSVVALLYFVFPFFQSYPCNPDSIESSTVKVDRDVKKKEERAPYTALGKGEVNHGANPGSPEV